MTSPLNGKEWSKDGWGTHMKGQNSGHEVAVHPYELRERHLDHRLGATLEHARDFGLNPPTYPLSGRFADLTLALQCRNWSSYSTRLESPQHVRKDTCLVGFRSRRLSRATTL